MLHFKTKWTDYNLFLINFINVQIPFTSYMFPLTSVRITGIKIFGNWAKRPCCAMLFVE